MQSLSNSAEPLLPYLAPAKISRWYFKRFKSHGVDKQTHALTNKHCWKRYRLRNPNSGKLYDFHVARRRRRATYCLVAFVCFYFIVTLVNSSQIYGEKLSSSRGLRSVKHKAAVLWNELPLTLKQIRSIFALKRNLTRYFCHHTEVQCTIRATISDFDLPAATIFSYHDIVAARSAVGRSPSPVRWPGMRCLTTSETRRSVPTISGRS